MQQVTCVTANTNYNFFNRITRINNSHLHSNSVEKKKEQVLESRQNLQLTNSVKKSTFYTENSKSQIVQNIAKPCKSYGTNAVNDSDNQHN